MRRNGTNVTLQLRPAQFRAQALAGSLYGTSYQYPGIGWTALNPASPPAIPVGTTVTLAVWWVNRSDANVKGHVDLTITKPNGQAVTLTAAYNQDQVAAPNIGYAVVFQGLLLDAPGVWKATQVLSMEAAGAANVTVTLKPRNAPANAAYWVAMCGTYPGSDYIPIANPITWSNVPAGTPQQWVIFGCFDTAKNMLQTPNAWYGVTFSRPFEDGKTYYWDFVAGLLLDESFQPM